MLFFNYLLLFMCAIQSGEASVQSGLANSILITKAIIVRIKTRTPHTNCFVACLVAAYKQLQFPGWL